MSRKIVITRLTKIIMAIFALDERLPTSATLVYTNIYYKDTRSTIQKLLSCHHKKKKTKQTNGTLNLEKVMETDDDYATMRESFSLVHIILFICYTDVLPPAH